MSDTKLSRPTASDQCDQKCDCPKMPQPGSPLSLLESAECLLTVAQNCGLVGRLGRKSEIVRQTACNVTKFMQKDQRLRVWCRTRKYVSCGVYVGSLNAERPGRIDRYRGVESGIKSGSIRNNGICRVASTTSVPEDDRRGAQRFQRIDWVVARGQEAKAICVLLKILEKLVLKTVHNPETIPAR